MKKREGGAVTLDDLAIAKQALERIRDYPLNNGFDAKFLGICSIASAALAELEKREGGE